MTTFSPVTETEMNEFFARITSTIREYSTLPDKLATVEGAVDILRQELADVRQQNDQLRRDNADATELAKSYETERDQARSQLNHEKDRSSHLSDLIMARDSRVAELQRVVDDLGKRNSDLDRECSRLNSSCDQLEDNLKRTQERRDYWKARFDEADTHRNKLEAELKAIEEKLSALGFHRPKVEEPVKASEANPTASIQTSTGSPSQTAPTAPTSSADTPSHPTSPEASPPSETSEQTTQESLGDSKPEMKPVIHEDSEEEFKDGFGGTYRPF